MSNEEKERQLGMSLGKANHILGKSIMFDLLKSLNRNICYQCGSSIENIDDLSIEHKIPWLYSENPQELFFDLDNISFSHLKCNMRASRKEYRRASGLRVSEYNRIRSSDPTLSWCCHCRKFLPLDKFNKCSRDFRGISRECNECRKRYRK